MMTTSPRHRAIEVTSARDLPHSSASNSPYSQSFGSNVFGINEMRQALDPTVFANVERAMAGLEKIRPENADPIAKAMKEWAISLGATHFTHWFLPLTGASAEKHDSFIDWNGPNEVVEKFDGAQLLQGEPDASSFPSGHLRTTFEARGYTGWDPSSPAFIWCAGDGVTLFIPSVFFSWTGEVLDAKIPLHRSSARIKSAAKRLLRLQGNQASHVYPTVGAEQEYFIIDRSMRNLRPDLVLLGRTVFGAPSPKGQELQDHYFGSVKNRILRFMRDFESEAVRLGIPVKTRHNEVAPAQHEIANVYEEATLAADHNIVLMELMRQIAENHDLACLLNEKPFAGLNGSGKHTNWSLATDLGENLLQPASTPEGSIRFLILITAIVHAVWRHGALLRASVGSPGNDHRLGGHEAPPAIMSVYLGEELDQVLDALVETGQHGAPGKSGSYDLGIPIIPELSRDNTDRNRTSPLAFTGAKFEFRAVGSSANIAEASTVLNVIVAESLDAILDQVEAALPSEIPAEGVPAQQLAEAVAPVLGKFLSESKGVRFSGDNYTEDWQVEAQKRGLPNIPDCVTAFDAYLEKSTVEVFDGVLTEAELKSRWYILLEGYSNLLNIEANLMVDIFRTQVLPPATEYQHQLAATAVKLKEVGEDRGSGIRSILRQVSDLVDQGIAAADHLELCRSEASALDGEPQARAYCDRVQPAASALRVVVDQLEGLLPDSEWVLPKYREMLFCI